MLLGGLKWGICMSPCQAPKLRPAHMWCQSVLIWLTSLSLSKICLASQQCRYWCILGFQATGHSEPPVIFYGSYWCKKKILSFTLNTFGCHLVNGLSTETWQWTGRIKRTQKCSNSLTSSNPWAYLIILKQFRVIMIPKQSISFFKDYNSG